MTNLTSLLDWASFEGERSPSAKRESLTSQTNSQKLAGYAVLLETHTHAPAPLLGSHDRPPIVEGTHTHTQHSSNSS